MKTILCLFAILCISAFSNAGLLSSSTGDVDCPLFFSGPQCECEIPSQQLVTELPPVFDPEGSGFNTQPDELTLIFNISSKYYDVQISFQNENSLCNIDWTSVYNGDCTYSYSTTNLWGEYYPDCGITRDNTTNPDFLVFEGEFNVQGTEDLDEIRGTPVTRTITSNHVFQVLFPRSVEVSFANVSVFAPIDVQAAIIAQSLATETLPPQASVDLFTSVQYPFVLQSPAFSLSASGTSTSLNQSPDSSNSLSDCPDTPGTPCQSVWNLFIDVTDPERCNIDGDYAVTLEVTCQQSVIDAGDCPVDVNTDEATIQFSLQSSFFCAVVIEEIDLDGVLSLWEDSALTVPKTSFLIGQRIYARTDVSSTEATIIASSISDIWVDQGGVRTDLLQSGSNTVSGVVIDLQVSDSSDAALLDTQSSFNFLLVPSVFPVDADSSDVFDVFAVVQVTYQDTFKSTTSKTLQILQTYDSSSRELIKSVISNRDLSSRALDDKNLNADVSSSFSLQGSGSDAAMTISPSIALLLSMLIALIRLF